MNSWMNALVRKRKPTIFVPSIQSHFPWFLLILDPAFVWTQQIQGKNRPLAERAGFPQSALSPNNQSKWCWSGPKASNGSWPQLASMKEAQNQQCMDSSSISFLLIPQTAEFPSVNQNNEIEIKSALDSRKMSKTSHGPQLLRDSPPLSLAS